MPRVKTKIRRTPVYKLPNDGVVSRYVYQHDKWGRRIQGVRWGKWMVWNRHKTMAENVREAVEYAGFTLKMWGEGSVVYILKNRELLPIYHTKKGHDGSSFKAWKPNPLAEYWRRRI